MKMVKKCLIAIAVVALLAATVQAADPAAKYEGDWPWTKTYDSINICTFDVSLEVGHFVQIQNCTGDNKREMKLQQVECSEISKGSGDFPCYSACVTITARANFVATLGANFDREAGDKTIIGGDKFELGWTSGSTIGPSGAWEDSHLCMKAWAVQLWASGATSGKVTVGTITITVKPENESGGSGGWHYP
jgi:hypothetical protein